MKAIVYDTYGPSEVLRYSEAAVPAIGDHDVLVRQHATSINHGDRVFMHGLPGAARLVSGLRRPKRPILGRAVAGTVAAAGPKVTRFAAGDAVLGEAGGGAFAEYVAVPESRLVVKPAGLTFERAATLPVAATTALAALRLGEVGPGRSVLLNGASGGVGTFAVRLARALGAEVTGVCSTRNVELVGSIGAHHVLDYTTEDLLGGPRGFDAVIDFAGGHRVGEMRRLLAPRGVYVASTGDGGRLLGPLPRVAAVAVTRPFTRHRLRSLTARPDAEALTHLAGLAAAGELLPVIEETFALEAAPEAMRLLETRHARGKLVLLP
ncbi:NAD(P)-dependent alcohol dehydrogenase [Spongiactinospora gelatinilytica]|uniref:NAD(P)-dependent alcohol dehydrogenase n=1 Tax=Spongiactinospora gelatinilytica TaxID=2666298 RepID=A0A2W2G9A9_9ACTN|nr:NAD(P)-dependent alcohol dehydrogenase [Spongiactinospora gelatinilytica]PZG36795.1 NAD(P)-dependent alcohol dehydrogenase [Spongiactinospora gelatinilytica]